MTSERQRAAMAGAFRLQSLIAADEDEALYKKLVTECLKQGEGRQPESPVETSGGDRTNLASHSSEMEAWIQEPPLTKQSLLAGRSFSELSENERELYGKLHRQSMDETVAAIVTALNRYISDHGHGPSEENS